MTKNTKIQFAKRYHAALRLNLRQRPSGRLPPRSAGSLGRAAVSLGLDPLDLARVHDRAVAARASPRPLTNGRNGNGPLPQAGVFFLEALTPIEQTHQAAQTAASHAQRLDGVLRERTTALVATRRQMRREIARRKIGERQLVQGAQHYSQLLAQSRRLQDQSRRLAHQILSAQEEERKEISRELHDEVAQILAGINVQLAALKEAAAINSRSLRQRIAQTQRLVEQSVEVVHRYARELRPALLDDLGLSPALRSYIKNLPGRKGLRIRFTAFSGVEVLNNTRRTVLYRVAQEALTNVARHAHARLVTVRIHQIPDAVRLEVHDDGKSFPVDRILASNTSKRLGLLGMRERVEMVGGDFAIESAPGKGTTVRAEIPFRGNHPGANS
jgi:two-component system sensor histidine kinase DegS